MKPIDVNQIGKLVSDETLKSKQSKQKTDSKFEEILESELGNIGSKPKSSKVDNIMPQSQLLNISEVSSDKLFLDKGLELVGKTEDILSKIVSSVKENKNVKGLFSSLNSTVSDLSKISDNIQNKEAKELIDKTVFISNIEMEKYIRGDYS
jgi:hypothetical protein